VALRRLTLPAPPEASAADAILDAALRVIARGGVRAAHFADIAEEAGVSTALPRYYHGTLDGLLAAAFARFVGQRRDRMLARAALIDDPRERVRDAVLADTVLTPGERRDARVIWHEFLRLGFVREDLRGAVGAAVGADIDRLAGLIAEAQAVDAAAAGVVPLAAARRLVEALNGLDLGGLLGLVDDEQALRILSWVVADELDQA
jgi:AcrR family transcriptional regulator